MWWGSLEFKPETNGDIATVSSVFPFFLAQGVLLTKRFLKLSYCNINNSKHCFVEIGVSLR